MKAAKAAWVVTAGVLPGDSLKRYEFALGYTSDDLEADRKTQEKNGELLRAAGVTALSEDEEWGKARVKSTLAGVRDTIFMERREEALEHARKVMDPDRVNWVRVEFVWY